MMNQSAPLNTHFVGKTGIRTIWVAAGLQFASKLASSTLPSSSFVRIVLGALDETLSPLLTGAGGYLAYRGRPDDLAPSDAVQKEEAKELGLPPPVTLAKAP